MTAASFRYQLAFILYRVFRPLNHLKLNTNYEDSSSDHDLSSDDDSEDQQDLDDVHGGVNVPTTLSNGHKSPDQLVNHQSIDSDDLQELSKYLRQKESLKSLKSEMAMSKRKLQDIQSSKKIKLLFMKTLEKLIKYKNENHSMMDKIKSLQDALEFKDYLEK